MDEHEERPTTLTPDEARQGEIILRRRWERLVFFGGLAAFVILVVLLRFGGKG